MNLVGDGWIPVLFGDGAQGLVGLKELFEQAEHIRDLSANPPQRIALMRLLLCITHAALDGPKDEADWETCRPRVKTEALRYLEEKKNLFNLFGDRPFLQVPALTPTNNASVDKLDLGSAAGNNPVLFDHAAVPEGRCVDASVAALSLLTFQCFSPGGTIGVTSWRGNETKKNSEHAPCIEGSPLHLIIRGFSLEETLWLNLSPQSWIKEKAGADFGTPVWEKTWDSFEGPEIEAFVHSFAGRLAPLSRGILLDRDLRQCTLVNGLAYPKLPEARDPFATVVGFKKGSQEGYRYVSLDLARHPWRELSGILTLHNRNQIGAALALEHLESYPAVSVVDLWMGGLAADKGKLLDMAEWVFSIPVNLLNEGPLEVYGHGVEHARKGEAALRNAVTLYAEAMKLEGMGSMGSTAVKTYWTSLDTTYSTLIEVATGAESNFEAWCQVINTAMRDAYRAACPQETPRQMKAFVQGRRKLFIKEVGRE